MAEGIVTVFQVVHIDEGKQEGSALLEPLFHFLRGIASVVQVGQRVHIGKAVNQVLPPLPFRFINNNVDDCLLLGILGIFSVGMKPGNGKGLHLVKEINSVRVVHGYAPSQGIWIMLREIPVFPGLFLSMFSGGLMQFLSVLVCLLLNFRLLVKELPGQLGGSLGMRVLKQTGRLVGMYFLAGLRGIDKDHIVGIIGQGVHQVQIDAQLLVALFQGPADLIHGLDIVHQNLVFQFQGLVLLLELIGQIPNRCSQKGYFFS